MDGYVNGADLQRWLVELDAPGLPDVNPRSPQFRSLFINIRDIEPVAKLSDGRVHYRLTVHAPDEIYVFKHLTAYWPGSQTRTIKLLLPAAWAS